MKLSELAEMYDTRKEFRREAGDLNYHRGVEQSSAEVWITKDGKKLSGPFKSKEAAESFKKNRPDRIPADAVIR